MTKRTIRVATQPVFAAMLMMGLFCAGAKSAEPAASQPDQAAPASATGSPANESPQWRGGPARTGDFSGSAPLAESLPASGPKLLWKTALPRTFGHGSISVAGGRAYLAFITARPAQKKPSGPQTQPNAAKAKMFGETFNNIYCLNAETGAVVWKQEFPCLTESLWGAGGTPAIVDGRVYVTLAGTTERVDTTPQNQDFNGTMYCLDAADGKVIWQTEQESSGTGFKNFGGLHSSPLVVDRICVVAGAATVAYEAATGKILWAQKCVGEAYASPALWRSGGQAYLLCNSKYPLAEADKTLAKMPLVEMNNESGQPRKQVRAIYCLDLKTGAPKWAAAVGAALWVCGTPAIVGDVMIDQGFDGVTAIRLYAEKPARLWFTPLPGGGHFGPSPAVGGDYIYADGRDEIACLKFAGGEKAGRLSLSDAMRPMSGMFMSPAAANGMVVYSIASGDPKTPGKVVLARGGPEVRELARFPAPGLLEYCSPTLVNGKLFVRLHEGVACYDLRAAAGGEEKRP